MAKGQVTIFIILGVMLLMIVVAALFFIRTSDQNKNVIDTIITDTVAGSSQEEQSVRTLVASCLNSIVPEGLEIMRLQGGYINIPNTVRTFDVEDEFTIYENNGKHIVRQPGINKVPYLLIEEGLRLPTPEYFAQELSTYVDEQLPMCTNGFANLQDEAIITTGNVFTDTRLGRQTIVRVNYPITITKGDKITTVDNYSYSIDIDTAQVYNLTYNILLHEMGYTFIEDHVKQQLSLYKYSGGNKTPYSLPPMIFNDVSFDCSRATWTTQEVNDQLKNIISSNMGYLKFQGARYQPPVGADEWENGVFRSFQKNFLPIGSDYEINFSYNKDWPFAFDISPKVDNFIEPDALIQSNIPFLPRLCTYKYAFKYDIRFPVLVTITDDTSKKITISSQENAAPQVFDNGYTFRFGIQHVLCGNQERECTGKNPTLYKDSLLRPDFETLPDTGFCDRTDGKTYAFTVNDAKTNSPVPGADIYFTCGSYQNNCFVARTNVAGNANGQIPSCVNGLLSTMQRNYTQDEQLLTTIGNGNESLMISLEPITTMNITVRGLHLPTFVRNWARTNGYTQSACTNETASALLDRAWVAVSLDPTSKERVIMQMTNKDRSKQYPSFPYPVMRNMTITSGNYETSLQFKSNITVRPSTYEVDDGPDVTVDFDNNPLVSVPVQVSWILGNNNVNWTLSRDDLLSKSTIEFVVMLEYLPTQDFEVKTFEEDKKMLKADLSLADQLYMDNDCDLIGEWTSIRIPYESYVSFIQPVIS